MLTNRQIEIIKASGKLLTERGVSGLTTKNLAKKMGFSESAIYRHFASKEDIILSMLNYLAQDMDERYAKVMEDPTSPDEKLRVLFRNQLEFFIEQPHFVVAIFSDGLLEESQRINEAILRIMSIKMKYLKPIIREGQELEVFTNSISSDELIGIIMGSFRLQMFKWRSANFEFDIMQKGVGTIEAILKLIKIK